MQRVTAKTGEHDRSNTEKRTGSQFPYSISVCAFHMWIWDMCASTADMVFFAYSSCMQCKYTHSLWLAHIKRRLLWMKRKTFRCFCLLSFFCFGFPFSLSQMMVMYVARLVSRYTAFRKIGEHMKWRKVKQKNKDQFFQPATILVTMKMIPTTQQKPYSKWMHCKKALVTFWMTCAPTNFQTFIFGSFLLTFFWSYCCPLLYIHFSYFYSLKK